MALAPFYEIIPRSNVMNFNCSRMINFWPTITKEKSLNYRKLREKLNKLNKNTFQKYVLFFVYIFCVTRDIYFGHHYMGSVVQY